MTTMFLEDDEVAVLTGRKFKSLQVDQLRRMGIPFFVNALGRAVVARAAIEGRGMAAAPAAPAKQPWVPKVLKAS
ncbi:DUF4224 domain-containing protein [Duganella sp.]|uniref:DUF4224 domain-containing protein n=1 Tax=Duganella sp. TaxID=1904440 RepID=UPI0031D418D3